MKKLIIHSVPVAVSFMWLSVCCKTCNPIALTGPGFLKFYLILTAGFYISVFSLKYFDENVSKLSMVFMISILILGIVKLIKGLMIGKPVGYIVMILIFEGLVILFSIRGTVNIGS